MIETVIYYEKEVDSFTNIYKRIWKRLFFDHFDLTVGKFNISFLIHVVDFRIEIGSAECFSQLVNPSGFACGKYNCILRFMSFTLLNCPT